MHSDPAHAKRLSNPPASAKQLMSCTCFPAQLIHGRTDNCRERLLFQAMTCHICKTIERELNDVVRTLRKRIKAQAEAGPATMTVLDLEIQALSKAKVEIEAKYLKHQTSCFAQPSDVADESFESVLT
jgi:hypothetical protein